MSRINTAEDLKEFKRRIKESGRTKLTVEINTYALSLIEEVLKHTNQTHPTVSNTINDIVCRAVMNY